MARTAIQRRRPAPAKASRSRPPAARPARGAPVNATPPRVLAIDVGGSHVKFLLSGVAEKRRKFAS
ncbi:MAG: hypothetical protein JOZ27_07665, partial [Caulobacteraceae bacterium]|nr:hypothetical protein [Caulobacteraceae bacterium]